MSIKANLTNTVKQNLEKALSLIENEYNWMSGSLFEEDEDAGKCYCALGALTEAVMGHEVLVDMVETGNSSAAYNLWRDTDEGKALTKVIMENDDARFYGFDEDDAIWRANDRLGHHFIVEHFKEAIESVTPSQE